MGTLCNKNLGDMCEAMSGDSKCTETDCLMLAYVVNKLDKNVPNYQATITALFLFAQNSITQKSMKSN